MGTTSVARQKPAMQEHRLEPAVEAALIVAVSIALLIPCFWQDHIEAGDLSSHVYNAWLASQVERGAVPGLTLSHQWTNILSDVALQWLIGRVGPAQAERIVVGFAVLLFFWGAFYLTSVVSQRRTWLLAPGLSMLAYGLVFHLGFLNFYLATGFSIWLIGLLWNFSRTRALIAIPVAIAALLAHGMPLMWAAAVLTYAHLLRAAPAKLRLFCLPIGIALLAAGQAMILKIVPSRWALADAISLLGATGTDQVRLFGIKYLIVVGGLLAIWIALFLERLDLGGVMGDPLIHIWILQVVAYVLMPSAILLPHYKHVLAYIPERISLFNGVMLCAVLGRARHGRGITRWTAAVATVFFTFLFLDTSAYSAIERKITSLAEQVPAGGRFVAEVSDSNSGPAALLHAADWACIGHCFSYANYEPATGQFRIQVAGPNGAAAADMATVQDIEEGRHIVTPGESPIFSVCRCEQENPPLCVRPIEPGEKTCSFSLPITWGFQPPGIAPGGR